MFDRLFDCAKLHIQAGVMVSRAWPFETIVMAVLLEQEKRIDELLKRFEARHEPAMIPARRRPKAQTLRERHH